VSADTELLQFDCSNSVFATGYDSPL